MEDKYSVIFWIDPPDDTVKTKSQVRINDDIIYIICPGYIFSFFAQSGSHHSLTYSDIKTSF